MVIAKRVSAQTLADISEQSGKSMTFSDGEAQPFSDNKKKNDFLKNDKTNGKTVAYIKNLVSVVIPTYNREKTLEASIKSVEDQAYDDIEIIVVDDGSTDGTKELVYRLASEDTRIRYMKNRYDKGASGARNTGIRAASGEYIAFNDSDDYFIKDKISKQFNKIRNADFCYGRFIKKIDDETYVIPPLDYKCKDVEGNIYELLLQDNLIGCPTLMARHIFLDRVGEFDTLFPALEDYDFALRLAKNGKAGFVEDIILDSGYSEGSLSTSEGNFIEASLMLLQKYLTDIVKAGLLDYKVSCILSSASRYGKQETAATIIADILRQYENTVTTIKK